MTGTNIEYRVRAGDTLYRIARRYNVTVEVLSLNNGISDINRIWAGQVLKIPQERQSPSSPPPKLLTHRVLAGETLSKIAQRNNVTVEALTQANGISDPNRIVIGQVLKIPQESQPTAQSPAPSTQASTAKTSSIQASTARTSSTQAPKTVPYNAGKAVKSFGRVRNDEGVNLHEKPKPDGAIHKKLPFNTRVYVSHELPGDWYFVTLDDGSFGYVYSKYVSINPPDPEAVLHKIKPNEGALEIVTQYYKVKPNEGFLGIVKQLHTGSTISWGQDWGQDERYYVNVLVEANRRKGLSGIYKPYASADWNKTQTREKYLIWIPSLEFAKSMRGKVGSGSISHDVWQAAKLTAEILGDYILGHAAFSAGLIHGILESIWDLLTGLVDLVELVWKILKSLITGEFLSDLKKLWDLVEKMDFKALVEVGLEAFRSRWYDKNFLKKWHFRGWVVGYAIAEIVMAIITGSAALVKWAGKAGKFSKLIAKFPKVLELAKNVTTVSKSIPDVAKKKLVKAVSEASERLPGKRLTPDSSPKTPTAQEVADRAKALEKSKTAAENAEAQYQAALKQFRTTLRASLSTLNSGVNPDLLRQMVALGYAAAKRGIKHFDVFWQEMKTAVEFKDLEKLSPEQLDELALAFRKGVNEAVDEANAGKKVSRDKLPEEPRKDPPKFRKPLNYKELSEQIRSVYTAANVDEIAAAGVRLGLSDKQIIDFLEMGSIAKPSKKPPKLPLTPEQVQEQMENWVKIIQSRGYPYHFDSLKKFQQFQSRLKQLLTKYGIPDGRMVIQGSSLRTPDAKDIDVAIFVSDEAFLKFATRCADGIAGRAQNPHAARKILKDLEKRTKDGFVPKYYFDRVTPEMTFSDEVTSLIEDVFKVKVDLSVMKSSSKLDLYPSLDL
ncbi:LysM peptidoglycan-binding domain-containing protein [Archangium violaceum]|uniref:SH3 domain-containing protein n=1 Tax=Archangium violaceum TaxID=83451 RepID=UPI00194F436F|nr:SH3 domain-containing protein [Archangium violaceum]QRO01830.1 LysM peptidoglycan-binding domain-containing protein [Archangium violaceum]